MRWYNIVTTFSFSFCFPFCYLVIVIVIGFYGVKFEIDWGWVDWMVLSLEINLLQLSSTVKLVIHFVSSGYFFGFFLALKTYDITSRVKEETETKRKEVVRNYFESKEKRREEKKREEGEPKKAKWIGSMEEEEKRFGSI